MGHYPQVNDTALTQSGNLVIYARHVTPLVNHERVFQIVIQQNKPVELLYILKRYAYLSEWRFHMH